MIYRIYVFIKMYYYLLQAYWKTHKLPYDDLIKWLTMIKINKKQNEIRVEDFKKALTYAHTFCIFNVECLQRSIAIYRFLMEQGIESKLCIGVRSNACVGHAWIETIKIQQLDESINRLNYKVLVEVNPK